MELWDAALCHSLCLHLFLKVFKIFFSLCHNSVVFFSWHFCWISNFQWKIIIIIIIIIKDVSESFESQIESCDLVVTADGSDIPVKVSETSEVVYSVSMQDGKEIVQVQTNWPPGPKKKNQTHKKPEKNPKKNEFLKIKKKEPKKKMKFLKNKKNKKNPKKNDEKNPKKNEFF